MKLLLAALAMSSLIAIQETPAPDETQTYVPDEIQQIQGNCQKPMVSVNVIDLLTKYFGFAPTVLQGKDIDILTGKPGESIKFPFHEKGITTIFVYPVNVELWDGVGDLAYVFAETNGCLIAPAMMPITSINKVLHDNGSSTIIFETEPQVDA